MFRIFVTLLLSWLSLPLFAQSSFFNAAEFTAATNAYINTSYDPAFGSNQDFSIEFRIKTSGWTGDPSIVSDKDWNNGLNKGFNIALGQGGTGIDVNVGDGTNRADLEAGNIDDGQWHHILVTFDRNGNLSLYIDKSLAQQTSMASVGDIASPYTFKIGQDGTTTYGSEPEMLLSELRIWNKVLPLNEVVVCDTINSSHPSWNSLLHYYKLNEGTGTTALDSKGANNGTLVGNVGWQGNNTVIIGCLSPQSAPIGIAAGHCLDFDGSNDYVALSNNSVLRPTQAITVECWFNPRTFNTEWESVLSHAQDNGGNESGYDFAWVNGKLRFRLKTSSLGSAAWDDNPGTNEFEFNTWQHIAGTYDGDTIRFYLNGVLKDKRAASGPINWTYLPLDFRIGMFHDDNEDLYFDGQVDEVRVWNVARSTAEIRANMCRKLTGNETGLQAYFRMDEGSGPAIFDAAPNALLGTMYNMSGAWQRSGAFIGDEAVNTYQSNWTGASLALVTSNRGNLQLDNVTGQVDGVQLIRMDSLPYSFNGLGAIADNDKYFAVFLCNSDSAGYRLQYNYTNYPTANTFENNSSIYGKASNESLVWTVPLSNKDLANNTITLSNRTSSGEYILADLSATVCAPPNNVSVSNVTTTGANIAWSGNANATAIEYGGAGFVLGGGTSNSTLSNSLALSGLAGDSTYEFYLQSICAGDSSAWVGPFSFTTLDPCPAQDSAYVLGVTGNSATIAWVPSQDTCNLLWGANFTLGQGGITTAMTSNPFTLGNLTLGATYKFYIQRKCNGGYTSDWIGPYFFTTDTTSGISALETNMLLFPNPTTGLVMVSTKLTIKNIRVSDISGKTILVSSESTINISEIAPGLYFIEIVLADGRSLSQKLIKQ